ncbi:ATP-binding protein [Streptomyces boninensis]|uniref:ATP-binding protein n=1 Tax=Streptomyces boninensis TaxID=2039455 RepID=UPI003B2252A1
MDYTMVDRSVRLTRIQARGVLTLWTWPGDVDDAVLIVSELVTNAIRHAQVASELMRLRLAALEDAALLIDVSDPSPAFGATAGTLSPPPPPAEAENQRGLRLVERLGAKLIHFLRAEEGGKTVRARLEK